MGACPVRPIAAFGKHFGDLFSVDHADSSHLAGLARQGVTPVIRHYASEFVRQFQGPGIFADDRRGPKIGSKPPGLPLWGVSVVMAARRRGSGPWVRSLSGALVEGRACPGRRSP